MIFSRNLWFVGLPFFLIGCWIKQKNFKFSNKQSLFLLILGFIIGLLQVVGYEYLNKNFTNFNSDLFVSTIFSSSLIFIGSININVKESYFYKNLYHPKIPLYIYIFQMFVNKNLIQTNYLPQILLPYDSIIVFLLIYIPILIFLKIQQKIINKRKLKMEKSKVYFTKDISDKGLLKIYEALGCTLSGKVAVKISTGEPGGHHFLQPKLIAPLVNKINGTIVESCTAYKGRRFHPKDHWEAIKEHGFLDIAPCDILDEDGEIEIPVNGGKHLQGVNIVGKNLQNYNSMLVLSHFKGHQMGGFGGALKNISIGIASRNGKTWIHSAGQTKEVEKIWKTPAKQDDFLESMAEASKAIIDFFKPENMAYINVANNLSIDCDCNAHPKKPEMADIGIFASLDPVALDQCCYDQIISSTDSGKKSLVERMEKLHAIHIVEESNSLNLGSREYELICID